MKSSELKQANCKSLSTTYPTESNKKVIPPDIHINQDRLKISVVKATSKHLGGLVQCHIKAFPCEFLSLLGPVFLRDFYRYYISKTDGIVLVALVDNNIVSGSVVGGTPELRSRFTRIYVAKHLSLICFKALTIAKVRKRLMQHLDARIKKIIRKRGKTNSVHCDAVPEDLPGTWASLLSICTHVDYRCRSVGSLLMKAFCAECEYKGYKTIRLSVHLDNEPAIALYKKCGWQIIHESSSGIYFRMAIGDQA